MLQFCHSTNYRGTHLNLAMVAYTAAAFHLKISSNSTVTKKDSVCRTYWKFIIHAPWLCFYTRTHLRKQLAQVSLTTCPADQLDFNDDLIITFPWWKNINMQSLQPSNRVDDVKWRALTECVVCCIAKKLHNTAQPIKYMCIYKVSTEWHVRNEEHSGTVGNVRIVKREITYNAFERVYLYIGYAMLSLH